MTRDDILPLNDVIEAYIIHALEVCGGNKSKTAQALDIDPKTLRCRLKQIRAREERR